MNCSENYKPGKLITKKGPLVDAILRKRLTTLELAKLVDKTRMSIHNDITYGMPNKTHDLIRMSEVLDVNPLYLLGYDVPIDAPIPKRKPINTNQKRQEHEPSSNH